MKIDVQTFIGEAPRISPRNLPENAAQSAVNCRMETTDLMAWRQFVSEKVLAAAATTIYKLNGAWLSWNADVDVARGPIPGDTNYFTFLTAPSLYATPRYTTYALATTGSEPFPVATRPIGMPAPTIAPHGTAGVGTAPDVGVDPNPTNISIDVVDLGDELATSWTINTQVTGAPHATVTQSVGPDPVPSYKAEFRQNTSIPAFAYRDFGIAGVPTLIASVEFQLGGSSSVSQATMFVATDADGAGFHLNYDAAFFSVKKTTNWSARNNAAILAITPCANLPQGEWHKLEAEVITNGDGTKTVIARIYDNGVLDETLTVTSTFVDGDFCGFANDAAQAAVPNFITFYRNFTVQGTTPTGYVATNIATSYVYTFVNNNVGGTGTIWESAPSPASSTILRPDGVSVTVVTATTHAFDADYGINRKYLYRSITGATGTVFYLLADMDLATPNFVDEVDDSDISNPGTVLPSEEWDLPPAGLKGIIPLPNGSMCGFFANQLCFSEIGRPHAWPVRYRLTTETDIVAIANIDNTVVIGTQGPIQVATGNSPGSYSMSKPGEPQACVSKRSMVYVDGYGVVYASPDGIQVCAGSAGNVKNATASIFTKPQWEALTPSSIRAAVYDGNLFFYFTGGTPDAGYMLDTKPGGAGLVRLEHHATAVHVDPMTDSLFMILDANNEPVEAALPVASSAVTPDSSTIFQFDAHASDRIRYLWRGKLNLMPHETTYHFAKVEAEEFANLVLRVYGDGALIYTRQVTSSAAFRVPAPTCYSSYEMALVGTSRARTAQLVQHIEECT